MKFRFFLSLIVNLIIFIVFTFNHFLNYEAPKVETVYKTVLDSIINVKAQPKEISMIKSKFNDISIIIETYKTENDYSSLENDLKIIGLKEVIVKRDNNISTIDSKTFFKNLKKENTYKIVDYEIDTEGNNIYIRKIIMIVN